MTPDTERRSGYDRRRREAIDERVREALEPIRVELKWQRWVLIVLCAATLSPKIGGPAPPQIADIAAVLITSVY